VEICSKNADSPVKKQGRKKWRLAVKQLIDKSGADDVGYLHQPAGIVALRFGKFVKNEPDSFV